MNLTGSAWNPEREDMLRHLYTLPINQDEIARRLSTDGVTLHRASVSWKIKQLKLYRPPEIAAIMKKQAGGNKTTAHGWTEERTEELRRLVAQGLSGSQIAKTMHLSRNQVVGRAHRMGFRLNGNAAQEARQMANVSIRPKRVRVRPKLVEGGMSPPKPKAPAVVPDLSRVYNGETVPFSQSGRFNCRYIIDAEATADARTCAARAVPGSAWCSTHRAICFSPPTPRRAVGSPMNATWRAGK